jgi:putative membrane protein
MSIWRPLPLDLRRRVARTVVWSPWLAPVRAAGRALGRPLGAWLAFSLDLVLWHIPAAYDLTLANAWVHAAEHITFLLFGILVWALVLDSPPLRSHLRPDQRVYYIISAAVVGWLLSLVLAFAPTPLYPAYAHLAGRPGGISALVDQQLAAGVMLGPGSLTMTVFVFVGLYRWLGQDEEAVVGRRERRTATRGVSR